MKRQHKLARDTARITSGSLKGRILRLPSGIRPTQEKVRKAFFDIIGDIAGLSFLELFAGSGAVGFEAVSRGVKELVLVENNRDCQLAISKNIENLKIVACESYPHRVEQALEAIKKRGRSFDVIFLDPPYNKAEFYSGRDVPDSGKNQGCEAGKEGSLAKKTLQMLGAYDILAPNGLIAVQHFKKDELPSSCGEFILVKEAGYGDTVLSFYRKPSPKA